MKKQVLFLLVVITVLLLPSFSAMAKEQPITFKETITVTEDGGRYQIGFVNVEFKKDFLDSTKLPATFDVEVYAVDGIAYIEFLPDTPDFFKKVHIRADRFEGMLFDKAAGENIYVQVAQQQVLAEHFSAYAFAR